MRAGNLLQFALYDQRLCPGKVVEDISVALMSRNDSTGQPASTGSRLVLAFDLTEHLLKIEWLLQNDVGLRSIKTIRKASSKNDLCGGVR